MRSVVGDGEVKERALNRRTFGQVAVAALLALAFGGAVLAVGSVLGAPFAEDEQPEVHLGGQEAPEFATLDGLLNAVEQAGVSCPNPTPIADPYATYAIDQVYPPTDAVRCSTDEGSIVLFVYESSAGRIDVYEQAVIQTEACAGVSEADLKIAHSVAGANWRVTSVGSDRVTQLVGYFDGNAVEEPLSCFAEE